MESCHVMRAGIEPCHVTRFVLRGSADLLPAGLFKNWNPKVLFVGIRCWFCNGGGA